MTLLHTTLEGMADSLADSYAALREALTRRWSTITSPGATRRTSCLVPANGSPAIG